MFLCQNCIGDHFNSHIALSFGRCESCNMRASCVDCKHSNIKVRGIVTESDMELAVNLVKSAKVNIAESISIPIGELAVKYEITEEDIREFTRTIGKIVVESYEQGHKDFADLMINNLK